MLSIEFELLERQIKTLTVGTENLDNCLETALILASDFDTNQHIRPFVCNLFYLDVAVAFQWNGNLLIRHFQSV